MNSKSNSRKKQGGNCGGRMGRDSGKQKKENMKALSPEQEAGLKQKAEEISKGLQSYTWRDLETGGKFTHNDKLTFIRDDMLIVGCDIGSERHYARAIDAKGRELSKGAYSFENNAEGFQSAKDWALHLAAQHGKNQIVLGVEPTGHYWFSLAAWMIISIPGYLKELRENTKRYKRGISNEQACIVVAADDEKNLIAKPVSVGRLETEDVKKLLSGHFDSDSTLITDSHSAYPILAKSENIRHVQIKADKHTEGRYNLANVNGIHSQIEKFMPESAERIPAQSI